MPAINFALTSSAASLFMLHNHSANCRRAVNSQVHSCMHVAHATILVLFLPAIQLGHLHYHIEYIRLLASGL
jgi:hypothetical protein